MTDREILAELKQSYEYLYDICENGNEAHCDGQMKVETVAYLETAMKDIEIAYRNFREQCDDITLRVRNLEDAYEDGVYITDHYIGENVWDDYQEQVDYTDDSGKDYIVQRTCAELGFYWYQDEDWKEFRGIHS